MILSVLIALLAGSTFAQSQLAGDLNKDYRVNSKDLRVFAWQWLYPDCLVPGCLADLDGANGVNFSDLAILAINWQLEVPHLVINEFMASNASAPPLENGELLDGNGESSDWIEIYNPTDTTVSLDGWYLTDSDANLTKWQFPDGNQIKPGEFMIVFASRKTQVENPLNYPYIDPAGYYHTNFELNQNREYLALVAPGGTAVVHEYWPEFPEQLTDISYGLAQYASMLVPTSVTASYHVPNINDVSVDWTSVGFNDSGWDTGETGLGFGTGTDTTAIALYRFDGDSSDSTGIHDGIPVGNPTYGNGIFNQAIVLNGVGDYVDTGKAASELGLSGNTPRTITAWVYTRSFNQGGIFEMGEEWSNGRDFSLRTMTTDNQWRVQYWGTSYDIDFTYNSKDKWVHFAHVHDGSETRIYADGQLIVPDTPRTLNTADTKTFKIGRWWNYYFDGLIDDFHVYDQALSQEDIQTIMDTGMITTSVQKDMLGINASLWIRTEFDLELGEPEIFDTLTLRMKYEDGFVAYINGQQVASRNAPSPVQWNSTSDSNRPIDDSSVFEVINLTAFLGTLQAGKNVLAIHGLNDDKDNGQFLILPELVAASNKTVPQYFTTATPGTFNIPGAKGVVSEVWFSHKRGFYNTGFQLILSTGDDDAEIRYTTDGSRPTITHGSIYSTPLSIDQTSTIRAAAVKPGFLDSNVKTHTYIFVSDVITQSPNGEAPGPGWPTFNINGQIIDYGMDPDVVTNDPRYVGLVDDALLSVPTISMVTDLDNLFDSSTGIYVNALQDGRAWERPASLELIYPDGSEGFQIDAGVRIRGGYGRQGSNPKHAFRLFFRNVYGDGKLNYPLFGDEGVDAFDKMDLRTASNYSWNFKGSGGLDHGGKNTMVREVFSRDVQREMGQPYTRSRYYHLYINGHYWGLFQTQERSEARYAESYLGGDKDDYDVVKVDAGPGRPYTIEATDGTLDAHGRLWQAAVAGFGTHEEYYRIQGLNTDGTKNPNYERLADIDNLIDYMLCTFYVGDFDAPISNFLGNSRPNNFYGVYNRNNPDGFRYFRHDAEHTMFELYEDRTGPYPAGSMEQYFNPQWLHQQLTVHPEYRLRFADHVHKHFFNDGVLLPNGATDLFVARKDSIDLAIIAESARWGDAKVSPPRTKDDDWLPQINSVINNYLPFRTDIVINQFKSKGWYPSVAAPSFNKHGGPVSNNFNLTMTSPTGTIYYTLDGSDPRQPLTGNAVGIPYSPVTLTKSTLVKARVLDGSTWSALNEATFAIGPVAENLRITEIMYHPRNAGELTDPNEEFVELKNIGTSTLNLNLVQFTEGIHFTFPDMELEPNECVVVVEDQAAFEARYGTSVNTAGQYTGKLANNGERIKLQDAIGRTILDLEYKDGWYPIADGGGFSLSIIEPGDSVIYSSEGLVAHWKFDDGSGNTATDSAGTNNGTLIGNPTWTGGRIDGALSFDGVDDYVVAAPVAALAGDTLTAQAWICVSEYAGMWNPIMTQNAGNGYYFYVATGKPAFYLVAGAGYVQAMSLEAINAEQWYHIAGTNDGSSLKLYVDGQLKDSDNSTGFLGVNSNAYIGFEPSSSLYYNGIIDDVRIYNRAVGESEFQNIANPMARWSRESSWRTSVYRYGTPGADDSGRLPNPGAVVINEVMAHSNAGPDWIELYNTTDEAINIGGWFLSDNNRDEPNLMKYKIADGTVIEPNDYLVFYQDTDFNNPGDPGCLVPFALSENGEEACLTSGLDPNGFLTGYRDVENFGASQTNVSLGRYYKSSTGNFNFVAMDYNTPDANNAYPKVGPIVINEIMYNPPTGNQNEEYIELHNITGAIVTLYRYDKSTPWKFTDGIDYTFSTGPVVTIQAHGYLVLAKDLTAFTASYGSMPPGVQVLEGYIGRLSNAGERLQIAMPGDIDDLGERHYIRIDRVTYSDGLHPEDCPGGVDLWPREADGLGKSLSRKVAGDYGNDVANWQAATPSPGTANP